MLRPDVVSLFGAYVDSGSGEVAFVFEYYMEPRGVGEATDPEAQQTYQPHPRGVGEAIDPEAQQTRQPHPRRAAEAIDLGAQKTRQPHPRRAEEGAEPALKRAKAAVGGTCTHNA